MKNFSVLSWNIQGELNFTGYTFFKKIQPHLHSVTADIVALQEILDAEKKLKDLPALKNYNIFIPKVNRRLENQTQGFNQNIILSKFPFLQVEEIVFPGTNHGRFFENCTRADIQIENQVLRIYNCHLVIFKGGILTRLQQLEHILADCSNFAGPVIICGDMNVTIPKAGLTRTLIRAWHQEPEHEMFVNDKFVDGDEREVFAETAKQHDFTEVFDLYTPTWSPFKSEYWELFGLKLDWFLIRNLEVTNAKLGEYISDHRHIQIECQEFSKNWK